MSNPILKTKIYNYKDFKILITVHGKRKFKIKNSNGSLIKKSKHKYTHTHKALEKAKSFVDSKVL